METIGQRLKKIRQAKSLSQSNFGVNLKMSKSGISAVENDKVFLSVDALRTLFFDFNVNLNYLIVGAGDMFSNVQPSVTNDELEQKVVEVMKKYGVIEK